MLHVRRLFMLSAFALLIMLGPSNASAEELKTVFVIAMENHKLDPAREQVHAYPTLVDSFVYRAGLWNQQCSKLRQLFRPSS